MKLARLLLMIGGLANALFFLFHLLLGWRIHHWSLAPGALAVVEMLNGGSAFYCLLLAVASCAFAADMLGTRLGRLLVASIALMYALRASAELVIAPTAKPAIFITCVATGLLYAGALLRTRPLRC